MVGRSTYPGSMTRALIDIGNLITVDPDRYGGRPVIAGTGTSVRQIVALYRQGYSTDEIVMDKDYLTLAQVHAALAYYYANPSAIETDMEAEAQAYDRLIALHQEASQDQE
uniref:DUF433 domain-containing protein n=1 Tax=Cyanothece sp. (strain PCC 7425 / ATCC 29141) TaxID=395961 RepID=B8HTZ4_CYAP4